MARRAATTMHRHSLLIPGQVTPDGADRARRALAQLALATLVAASAAAQVTWSPAQSAPPNGGGQAVTYDTQRNRLLVFGGQDHYSAVWFDQTWERTGGEWSLRPTLLHPAARASAAVAFDSSRGRAVMFGGNGAGWAGFNDTWEWQGSTWVQTSVFGTKPSPRSYAAMAYHAASGRMVMFGGRTPEGQALNDTWLYGSSGWTAAQVSSPPGRYYHRMAYDSARGRVVMFGGQSSGQLADTWEWDGTTWQARTPALAPPARRLFGMAYDEARAVTLIFGGRNAGIARNDTWQWDGTAWTQRASTNAPSARENTSMVFDAARQRCVLYGDGDSLANDLWEWDGSDWSEVSTGTPTLRRGAAMAFDPVRGRGLMFGGSPVTQGGSADTWEWNRGAWRRIATTTAPSPRSRAAMAYSAADRGMVLFGGEMSLQPLNDTWLWSGTGWHPGPVGPSARVGHAMAESPGGAMLFGGEFGGVALADTWTYSGGWRLRSLPQSPSARTQPAMAFDAQRLRTVLFGGRHAGNNLADTWEFDGTIWRALNPALVPPARSGHSMTYDALRERVVLFGGLGANGQRLDDTWEFDGTQWTQRVPALVPAPRNEPAMTYDTVLGQVVLFGGATNIGSWGFTDTWTYRSLQPADYRPFGAGCLPTGLFAVGRPWLGSTLQFTIGLQVPSALALGRSRTQIGGFALPLDLTVLGMAGCQLLTSSEILVPTQAGQLAFPVPVDANLVGQSLYVQGVAAMPRLNPAGLGVTPGAELVFGQH
jgi:hypothetical protein